MVSSLSLQLRLILDRVGEAGVKSAWFDPEACTQDVLEAYKKVTSSELYLDACGKSLGLIALSGLPSVVTRLCLILVVGGRENLLSCG
jgi:hypothetical protein